MKEKQLPTETDISDSVARINALKTMDLITILMKVRSNLDRAYRLTSDIRKIKFIQEEILVNCKTMDEIDQNYPDKQDIIHMISLFLMSVCQVPVALSETDHRLN